MSRPSTGRLGAPTRRMRNALRWRRGLALGPSALIVAGLLSACGSSAPPTEAPKVTSPDATTFTAGTPGSFTVTAKGNPKPTVTLTPLAAKEPGGAAVGSWLTVKSTKKGTTTLSGTPPVTGGGQYTGTVVANNGTALASQPFTLTVNAPSLIQSPNALTTRIGAPVKFAITSLGFPVVHPVVSGALPAGLSLASGPAPGVTTLSGTPAVQPNTGGIYPLSVTANNGVGTAAVQQFVLTVAIVPEFTSAETTSFASGQPASFTVTTRSFPTAALSSATPPPGLQLIPHPDGTATITGSVISTVEVMKVTATNAANLSSTQSVRIVPVSIISPNHVVFKVGVVKSFDFTLNHRGPGYPHPLVSGALPPGLALSEIPGAATTVLSGTAPPGTEGAYALTVTVNLGTGPPLIQSFALAIQ